VFINTTDNARLDGMGFAPIGKIVEGLEVVDQFHKAYGEAPSSAQARIQAEGNAFLKQQFPNLDYVKTAKIVPAAQ
jgi:peptidyl-prolyl cis-trans isomerase A (cyclophilin A)